VQFLRRTVGMASETSAWIIFLRENLTGTMKGCKDASKDRLQSPCGNAKDLWVASGLQHVRQI
jgi:hypothetical protein